MKPGSHSMLMWTHRTIEGVWKKIHTHIDKALHPEKTVFGVLFPKNKLWDQYSSKKLSTVTFIVPLFYNLLCY